MQHEKPSMSAKKEAYRRQGHQGHVQHRKHSTTGSRKEREVVHPPHFTTQATQHQYQQRNVAGRTSRSTTTSNTTQRSSHPPLYSHARLRNRCKGTTSTSTATIAHCSGRMGIINNRPRRPTTRVRVIGGRGLRVAGVCAGRETRGSTPLATLIFPELPP